MNGEIGPDTLGLNLAFDLRIVSNNTIFFSHNLDPGFPPSSILSFYLVQSLGSPLATELMLTKNELAETYRHKKVSLKKLTTEIH
jgi:enoyl-CoA hydratase/carnithine racemase